MPIRGRRPDVRRHAALEGAPARDPAGARGSDRLRRAGRQAARRRHRIRAPAVRGRRDRRRDPPDGGVRLGRVRPQRADDGRRAVRARGALLPGGRARERGRPVRLPARARRPAARPRHPGHGRPEPLRHAPPREERARARRDPPRPGRRGGGHGRRRADAARGRGLERRAAARRRDAHLRADQGCGRPGVHGQRRGRRRDHRQPRRAGRDRARGGLRPDPPGRDRDRRPLPVRQGNGLLRRHDAHVRRRRAVGRGARVAPARPRGARPLARGDPCPASRARPCTASPARSSRTPATRRS